MSELKRWDFEGFTAEYEDESGGWVKYSDVKLLEVNNAKLNELLNDALKIIDKDTEFQAKDLEKIKTLEAKNKELEAKVKSYEKIALQLLDLELHEEFYDRLDLEKPYPAKDDASSIEKRYAEIAEEVCILSCLEDSYDTEEKVLGQLLSKINELREKHSDWEQVLATQEAPIDDWISVEDRLPEKQDEYLIYPETKYSGPTACFWPYSDHRGHIKNTFYLESEYDEISQLMNITHWQPITPPQDKG
jgi:hypothetical protein